MIHAVAARYAVGLTQALVDLIDRDDANDPIARQFVPGPGELITTADERADPIGDNSHSPVPGIVHRYRDRVLFKPVHVCPVYCRFCFRREMVGPGAEALNADEIDGALSYIASRPEIFEVILTGGDPLMLSPRRLGDIFARLSAIPHVATIRVHSRVPIADPDRINDSLVAALKVPKSLWLSIHCNHVRELGPSQRRAIARLTDASIPLLSQSVLLKGVNNSVDALTDLFRAFVTLKIKPYYLHHPDLAPGTSAFRLTIAEGRALAAGLWHNLPGFARPTYVLDIPGGAGKIDLMTPMIEACGDGRYIVTGLDGRRQTYPPTE
jgi:lysine 2,3-aminomutase